ncbi:MAG: hypothetical protein WC326_08425 [Candidatus Delongbacteria bacterium]
MSTPRKKRVATTPKRENRNTDPHWTNWEYLAAFGEDDLGYTYLDAVKQFCSQPSEEERWLDELVRQARIAHDRAGLRRSGRHAAWSVFRRAGMILLHNEMHEMKVKGKHGPRAVFLWPATALMVVVGTNWQVLYPKHPSVVRASGGGRSISKGQLSERVSI